MKKIFPLILVILLTGCNKYVQFTDWYVAFDTSKSSTSTVDEMGEFIGSYYVHYCGILRSNDLEVKYSIIPGDGLKEGIDFEMENAGETLKFLPGVYDLPIRISWLPNAIDTAKDNTLIIRIESCNDHDVIIGYPGPDNKGCELVIRKYKN